MTLELNTSQSETLLRILHGAMNDAEVEELHDIMTILSSIYAARATQRKNGIAKLYGKDAK